MRVKVSWGPNCRSSHPWGGRSGGLQDTGLLTALGRTRASGRMSIRSPHTYELINGYDLRLLSTPRVKNCYKKRRRIIDIQNKRSTAQEVELWQSNFIGA